MKVADDISRGTLECEWVNTFMAKINKSNLHFSKKRLQPKKYLFEFVFSNGLELVHPLSSNKPNYYANWLINYLCNYHNPIMHFMSLTSTIEHQPIYTQIMIWQKWKYL